ncbi:MAG: Fic family protein [Pseudomonadota bacterium]
MYIWERPEWPNFRWDDGALSAPLADASHKQGRLLGRMEGLGFDLKLRAHVETLTEDVIKSSEIEGEVLDRDSVRSSVARRLGMPEGALAPSDQKTEGVVEMMLNATQRFDQPLTAERLCGWQASLFPTGFSGMRLIRTGMWRDDAHGPMQVVSGAIGRERVHYEAPPANRVDDEMRQFAEWFGRDAPQNLLRAGLAHLWFVTIHPFEDGNGRIARAIADQALAQLEKSPQRFYSLSSQIRKERKAYYDTLETTQKGSLDITPWLNWFLACFSRAIDGADETCAHVLRKAEFWQKHAGEPFSERQKLMLNRYLDGFDGKLTTKKWATIAKCAAPTAQRDINDLIERGILKINPGGSKNTSYEVVLG